MRAAFLSRCCRLAREGAGWRRRWPIGVLLLALLLLALLLALRRPGRLTRLLLLVGIRPGRLRRLRLSRLHRDFRRRLGRYAHDLWLRFRLRLWLFGFGFLLCLFLGFRGRLLLLLRDRGCFRLL